MDSVKKGRASIVKKCHLLINKWHFLRIKWHLSLARSATVGDPLPRSALPLATEGTQEWLPIGSATADCSLAGNMERDYCNDGASSILDAIENTARQLALSAKEIPINGNNCYI